MLGLSPPPTVVFCSPLTRAIQTAVAMFEGTGVSGFDAAVAVVVAAGAATGGAAALAAAAIVVVGGDAIRCC